ncbi:MAG: DnaJ domain-containing protein [Planctomycetota bacterium]
MSFWKRISKLISSQVNHWIDDLEKWVDPKEPSQKSFSSSETGVPPFSDVDSKLAQYYANLEVPSGASLEEIRRAYRQLIKQYHPDLYENDPNKRQTAEQILKKLNEAFSYLEDHFKSKENASNS